MRVKIRSFPNLIEGMTDSDLQNFLGLNMRQEAELVQKLQDLRRDREALEDEVNRRRKMA
jgi:hypothetical protein